MNKFKIDFNETIETWLSIEGFMNYQVSSFGNVRNIKTNRFLKPGIDSVGYYFVILFEDGKNKNFRVHKLVSRHFLREDKNRNYVDHVDNNKLNNSAMNLRFATQSENCGNRKKCKGTSIYKGVRRRPNGNFSAQIRKDGKIYCLGTYKTEIEAARAYDKKANELFGEYARLNISEDN